MITVFKVGKARVSGGKRYIQAELRGLSTDTKPVGSATLPYPIGTIGKNEIENGSVFIEIDTGKIYFYDLVGSEWNEA